MKRIKYLYSTFADSFQSPLELLHHMKKSVWCLSLEYYIKCFGINSSYRSDTYLLYVFHTPKAWVYFVREVVK